MKTVLICHEGELLVRQGMARWLNSFSDLTGVVVLKERNQRIYKRIRREIRRVNAIRFLDVLAFRLYYRLFRAAKDLRWEQETLDRLCADYPALPPDLPTLVTHSPNSPEAQEFIKAASPDIMIARCKSLLKRDIFSVPTHGTFVMHPGVCPEYRNAHGCFWALASNDADNVGMTLLRIDEGVDTGPVYGYFTYDFDEREESHFRIQHRVVIDNLDALRARLLEIDAGTAATIDTTGRSSSTWGQPWLTAYLRRKMLVTRTAK